jgi:hypothetical protein
MVANMAAKRLAQAGAGGKNDRSPTSSGRFEASEIDAKSLGLTHVAAPLATVGQWLELSSFWLDPDELPNSRGKMAALKPTDRREEPR